MIDYSGEKIRSKNDCFYAYNEIYSQPETAAKASAYCDAG
jgi:hypothetical protein